MGSKTQKAGIRKLRDIALDQGFDLRQLHEDQDPGFFVERGVTVGIARRFVRDIECWVERQKGRRGEMDGADILE